VNPVEARVKQIVATITKRDASVIRLDMKFEGDLSMDSLTVVEMMMALEEAFAVDIPMQATQRMITVRDAVEFIHSATQSG